MVSGGPIIIGGGGGTLLLPHDVREERRVLWTKEGRTMKKEGSKQAMKGRQ
jgi:hypothetical protein